MFYRALIFILGVIAYCIIGMVPAAFADVVIRFNGQEIIRFPDQFIIQEPRRRRPETSSWRTQVRRYTHPREISYWNNFKRGTVYVSTKERTLYYILSQDRAIAYPVAVGRAGFSWSGVEYVTNIKRWPDWRPPAEMRKREPHLPVLVKGGPQNPLGAAAIYLGDTLYRIHGTNDPESIGKNVSSGCIRMYNHDVRDLIKRIDIGTKVVVR